MVKLGKQRRSKRYNYSKNRRNAFQKLKRKGPIIEKTIKEEWVKYKSIHYNMESMGLATDPNKAVSKGKGVEKRIIRHTERLADKSSVRTELERQAAIPEALRLRMSEPDAQYIVYMLDKYDDDYKAMARDQRNHYQDTPKQIKKKIEKFKKIPGMYDAYLELKSHSDTVKT